MSEPSGTSGAAAEKAALWKRLLPILGAAGFVAQLAALSAIRSTGHALEIVHPETGR